MRLLVWVCSVFTVFADLSRTDTGTGFNLESAGNVVFRNARDGQNFLVGLPDQTTLNSLCHELGRQGVPSVFPFSSSTFGLDGSSFSCQGFETAARDCALPPTETVFRQILKLTDCDPAPIFAMLVRPNAARLVPTNTNQGLLVMFSRGFAGTVCDDRFDTFEGDMICRSMGYAGLDQVLSAQDIWTSNFDTLDNRAIWVDELDCSSFDTDINQCSFLRAQHDCSHTEDVVLRCSDFGGSPDWQALRADLSLFFNSIDTNLDYFGATQLGFRDWLEANTRLLTIAAITDCTSSTNGDTISFSCVLVAQGPTIAALTSDLSGLAPTDLNVFLDNQYAIRGIQNLLGSSMTFEFVDVESLSNRRSGDDSGTSNLGAVIGAIIGSVVGGLCCCALIIGVVCCACQRNKNGQPTQFGAPNATTSTGPIATAIQLQPMPTKGDPSVYAVGGDSNYSNYGVSGYGVASSQTSGFNAAPVVAPAAVAAAPSASNAIESGLARIQSESSEFSREREATAWLQTVPRQLTKDQGTRLVKMFTMSMCQKPVLIGLKTALINPSDVEPIVREVVDSDFQRDLLLQELARS